MTIIIDIEIIQLPQKLKAICPEAIKILSTIEVKPSFIWLLLYKTQTSSCVVISNPKGMDIIKRSKKLSTPSVCLSEAKRFQN